MVQRPNKTSTESQLTQPGQTAPAAGGEHEAHTPGRGSRREQFGKAHRLADSAAFSRVFGDACRSRDRLFTVLSRRNDSGVARLGLAISKKHCRRSTDRNRVKRIVRESFRRHLAMLAGLDVVVLAQSGTASAGNGALFDSLEKHWQKTRSTHASQSRTIPTDDDP